MKDAGNFLISLLPLLFVSPTVGIVESWSLIRPRLLSILLLLLGSTIVVFGVSGSVTQLLRRKDGDRS